MYRFCLLALAASLLFAAPALAQSDCATSPTGFVGDTPCYSFNGRLYKEFAGAGVESSTLLGPISADSIADGSLPLTKLADSLVPISVVSNAVRSGRSLHLPLADPRTKSLLLLRMPDSLHDDGTAEVRIRTKGSSPNVVFVWRSLVGFNGGTVHWSDMTANGWYLVLWAGDWFLLD